jgi:threonine dehydrogenase-like Zn-dependent dehydrogenase
LIYRKELEIRGSYFSPYSFQRAISLLPRLNLAALQTHVLPLQQIHEALDALKGGKAIKALLKP